MRQILTLLILAAGILHAEPEIPVWEDVKEKISLAGTTLLKGERDFAEEILEEAHRFIDQKIEDSKNERKPTPEELREILGLNQDTLVADPAFEYLGDRPGPLATMDGYSVHRVRWPAIRDIHGYGLLVEPEKPAVLTLVVIPDADENPESFLERLRTRVLRSNSDVRILIVSLIHRTENKYKMSEREYLHRPAYEMGRTLVGYELAKVLQASDILAKGSAPIAISGVGEGGRIALYAGALQPDYRAVFVGGYFSPRENVWEEPADRTVFGLLNNFGDAEIAGMVGAEKVFFDQVNFPDYGFRVDESGKLNLSSETAPGNGKPGRIVKPLIEAWMKEIKRIPGVPPDPGSRDWDAFVEHLGIAENTEIEAGQWKPEIDPNAPYVSTRQKKQVHEIDQHNQWALMNSRRLRKQWVSKLNTESLDGFEESTKPHRERFYNEIIGAFSDERVPLNARSRTFQKTDGVTSYQVVMDVFPGFKAYGILIVPDDLALDGSEKRPVVVCQHGLEGRPEDVIGETKFKAYEAFATKLAQQGYVTFAPQNLYLHHDEFRMLQFKANSVGKSLFSFIIPQHEQILDWLSGQPFVDAEKIGFYGLSYGGKSAMRIPAVVDRYALSICSADFNEWIWKNVATDPESLRYSYANKREYEMYEWNLGNTFNYAEMAALICPRPFMVERGHFDGVGPDEMVAFEYAKVRNLYAARLGIPEKTTIEWFPGPHKINGVGSFEFLDRWLK